VGLIRYIVHHYIIRNVCVVPKNSNSLNSTILTWRTQRNVAEFPSHMWIHCIAPDTFFEIRPLRIATFVTGRSHTSLGEFRVNDETPRLVGPTRWPALAFSSTHRPILRSVVKLSSWSAPAGDIRLPYIKQPFTVNACKFVQWNS